MSPNIKINQMKGPWWVNYTIAVLIQIALTAFQLAIFPILPIGKFPAAYAATLLFTVYYLGYRPAILALILSLAAYNYFFVPPRGFGLPLDSNGWAMFLAYIIVTGTVVFAVGILREKNKKLIRQALVLEDYISEQKRTKQELLEAEKLKTRFYRKTILAATENKLVISEPEEIRIIAGPPLKTWDMDEIQSIVVVRDEISRYAHESGMDEMRIFDFLGCVVEAVSNSIKHAHSSKASLHKFKDKLIFMVSDSGSGIGTMQLPNVALTKGYSTAGTLGMGYKVMIHFADKVYLATGLQGTTVAIEMNLHSNKFAQDNYISGFANI